MPGSRPIQSQPQGLLGFLQLKNLGQNPSELPDVLQPVLELRDWYLQTNSEIVSGTDAAIAAVGVSNNLIVPQGEYWFVHDVGLLIQLAAGATWRGAICYRNGPAGLLGINFQLAETINWAQATDGTNVLQGMTRDRPLIIPPDGRIGIQTSALSAPTVTGNVFARITRLKV